MLCVCFPADVFVTFQLNPLTRQCHSPSPTQPATSTDKQQAPLSNLLCESVQMLPSFPCSQIMVTILYLTTLFFKRCCNAHLNSFSSLAGKPTCSFSNGAQKLRKFFNFKIFFQAFSSYYETRRWAQDFLSAVPSTSSVSSAEVFSMPENTLGFFSMLDRVVDPFGLDSSTERPRHLLMLLILSQLTERHFTRKAGSENWTQEDGAVNWSDF